MKNKKEIPSNLTLDQYRTISLADMRRYKNNVKMCLFDNADCTKLKVNSHSIQEAALKKISNTNTVLHFFFDVYEPSEYSREYCFKIYKINTSEASIFHGFCSYHDKKLFEEIEDSSIQCLPSQIEKLHFRSIAFSAFQNKISPKIFSIIKNSKTPIDLPRIKERNYIRKKEEIQRTVFKEFEGYLEEAKNDWRTYVNWNITSIKSNFFKIKD